MRKVLAHKAKCRATGIHTPYDEKSSEDQMDLLSSMPREKNQRKSMKQVKQIMGMMNEQQQEQMRSQLKHSQPQLSRKLDGKCKSPFQKLEPAKPETVKKIYVPAALRVGQEPTPVKRSFARMQINVPKINELSKCTFGEKRSAQPFSAKRNLKDLFSDKPAYVSQVERERNIGMFTRKHFKQHLKQFTMECGQTNVKILRVIHCPANAMVKVPGTSVRISQPPCPTMRQSFTDPNDPLRGYYCEDGVWYECENANLACREYAKRLDPIVEILKTIDCCYIESLAATLALYGITQETNESNTTLSFHAYCEETRKDDKVIVPKLPLFWLKIQ